MPEWNRISPALMRSLPMKPESYLDEVRTWKGTPFRHKGLTKGLAVDCIGLVYGSAVAVGLVGGFLPDYAKSPQGTLLEQSLKSHPDVNEVNNLKPGDILLFKFAKFAQHVGIYTGRNLIHSYEPVGGYTEHRYCSKWENRRVAVFRFNSLA